MPGANILWSPRAGFNYDVAGDQKTQLRGGTGVFTGQPLYVWISNQLGNTGMLQGTVGPRDQHDRVPVLDQCRQVQARGDRPAGGELRAERHRQRLPVPAGLAQQHRRRPPPARRDSPAPRSSSTTATSTASTTSTPTCRRRRRPSPAPTTARAGPAPPARHRQCRGCVTHQQCDPATRSRRSDRPEEPGHRPQLEPRVLGVEADVARARLRTAYSYGEAKNTIDPGSTAGASWNSNPTPADPNNPGLGYLELDPGPSLLPSASYTKQYFGFGATSISGVLGDAHAGQHQLHLCRGRQRRHRLVERSDLHPAQHGRR